MDNERISIEDYLARGGVLTSPANAPPRYRAELMKIMARFVDSELAGSAGFADVINAAPGLKERIAAARIVLEKTSHAETVLDLMGEFGANTARYASHHPWTARQPRDTPPGAAPSAHDMRLSVFNYPLEGWTDAVVMNLVMGLAVGVQLAELSALSYQPLAEAFTRIAPVEANHVKLAREGLSGLLQDGRKKEVTVALDYWRPRVAPVFGPDDPDRFRLLQRLGLRHRTNTDLRMEWSTTLDATLRDLHLG